MDKAVQKLIHLFLFSSILAVEPCQIMERMYFVIAKGIQDTYSGCYEFYNHTLTEKHKRILNVENTTNVITYQNIKKNNLFLHYYSKNQYNYTKLCNFDTVTNNTRLYYIIKNGTKYTWR